MRDFNYFEPYLGGNEKITVKKLGKYIVLYGVATLMILYPAYNTWQIYKAQKETLAVSIVAHSSEIQEGKVAIEEMERELEAYKAIDEQLQVLELTFRQKDMINDLLINALKDNMPQEVFLQIMKIQPDIIELQGVAQDRLSIAILENNLRKINVFENIFIPSVIESSNNYTFTLRFSTKDGDEK